MLKYTVSRVVTGTKGRHVPNLRNKPREYVRGYQHGWDKAAEVWMADGDARAGRNADVLRIIRSELDVAWKGGVTPRRALERIDAIVSEALEVKP